MKKYQLVKTWCKVFIGYDKIVQKNIGNLYLYIEHQNANIFKEGTMLVCYENKAGRLWIDFENSIFDKDLGDLKSFAYQINNSIKAWLIWGQGYIQPFLEELNYSDLSWEELTLIPEFSKLPIRAISELQKNTTIYDDKVFVLENERHLHRIKPKNAINLNTSYMFELSTI